MKTSQVSRSALTRQVLLTLMCLTLITVKPSADGRYGVLATTSGESVAGIIAHAGGTIVSVSDSDLVGIAYSDKIDFWFRLYASGARFVFNPMLASGCQR